jgi:DNA repair protein RecO (recombination protein O)
MITSPSAITEGLVLGSSRFSEDSAVVSFVGPEGLVSFLARGIYKPKSALKPLLITGDYLKVEYRIHDNGPSIATSVEVLHDASPCFSDYPSSCFLMMLNELSEALFRFGDAFPYQEVNTLVVALSDHRDPLSLSLLLLGSLYRCLGLKINVGSCLGCGKAKDLVTYSLSEGGFLCKACAEKLSVPMKPTMSLFVLKYAFAPIDDAMVRKVVPKGDGIRVLSDLMENLVSYFDLREIRSYPLFLRSLGE